MRVKVWSGDGRTYLGEGVLKDSVSVYLFRIPEGLLISASDCEEYPSQELIDDMSILGGTLEQIEANPKIVLDDDTVKYGCQVWWERKDAVPDNNSMQPTEAVADLNR